MEGKNTLIRIARRTVLHLCAVTFLVGGVAQAQASDPTELASRLASGDKIQAAFDAARYGPEAIPVIAPLIEDSSFDTRSAAQNALERIVAISGGREDTRRAASTALCEAIPRLQTPEARKTLLRMLSVSGGPEAAPRLREWLGDAELCDMAIFALQAIGGPVAAQVLLDALTATGAPGEGPRIPSERRVAAIKTLGNLREPVAIPALRVMAQGEGPEGRLALFALARLGDAKAEAPLRAAILETADSELLGAYLELLQGWSPAKAAPKYRSLLENAHDSAVRTAAIDGYARSAGAKSVKVLLPCLVSDNAGVAQAAEQALRGIPGSGVNTQLVKACAKADPELRWAVLAVLQSRAPETAWPLLEPLAKGESPESKARALEVLLSNPGEVNLSFLAELAAAGGADAAGAYRGYLRLAEQAAREAEHGGEGAAGRALERYSQALALAQEDSQQNLVLRGMKPFVRAETLPALTPYFAKLPVKDAAYECATAAAMQLLESDPSAAKSVFEQAVANGSLPAVVGEAADGLAKLGASVNLIAQRGAVLHWQVIGPFPYDPQSPQTSVHPPERQYRPRTRYEGAGRQRVAWRSMEADPRTGLVDLLNALKPNLNVVAYARAEVSVPTAQTAVLRLGSQEGLTCWLNGTRVYSSSGQRPLTLDGETVTVSLQAGTNVIQLKVPQTEAEWAASARITDPEGRPIAGQ